jgi:light-regulated signal transduction histidine kinase (bacteriophytochrome)
MAKIMEFPVGDSNASLQYFKSRIHPDDLQDILNLNEYSIKNLKPYMSEYRFLRNDGSIQYIQLNAELELDHTGTPIKLIGTAQDVTIRKMTKIKLEKANLDLQKMNVELESFCYSVSHDLRSPLCTIMGLNQIILRNHSNNLNLDIKKSLEMVMKASNRMELVIDGQLDLARLSKTTLKIEEVNLSQIAQDISIELQASNPERNVNFDITPNIKAKGDLKLLSLVLLNLINNSFKFTTNKSESIIEFGILNNNKQITYFVRDNGAGFDMRHSSKLFGAFERLHTEREFPGLGIGLSTVERIIKRHAGNIWAEAKPNIGATFYFTL